MWSPTASLVCTILLLHVLLLLISNPTTSTPTTFITMPQMGGAARRGICSSLLYATTASRRSSSIVGAVRLRRSQDSSSGISGNCLSLVQQQPQQQIARLSAYRHDDDRKAMLWWVERTRKKKKSTQMPMARGPSENQKPQKQPQQTVSKTVHLDAVFAVYKPQGWSSSSVVQKIKVCCPKLRCVVGTIRGIPPGVKRNRILIFPLNKLPRMDIEIILLSKGPRKIVARARPLTTRRTQL